MSSNFAASIVVDMGADGGLELAGELGLPAEILGPLLAGARARGFADALELTGQAAFLLDDSGAVLHMTSHAARWIGAGLRIAGGHLVGHDSSVNQKLGAMIEAALAGPYEQADAEDVRLGEGIKARIQAKSFGDAMTKPCQLLKAVVLVETVG